MARTQNTSLVGIPLDDSKIGRPIRISGGAVVGVDDLAKNANGAWGQFSPTVASGYAWDATQDGYLASTDAAGVDRYAIRLRWGGDSRDVVRLQARGYQRGGATGNIWIRSVLEAPATYQTVAITGGAAWAWYETPDLVVKNNAGDLHDIWTIGAERTNAAGSIDIREWSVYRYPAATIPTGVEPSGFEAIDDAQADADSPLDAKLVQQINAAHTGCREDWAWPIGGMAEDLANTTKQAFGTLTTTWTRLTSPLVWEPSLWRGMDVDTVEFSLGGYCAAAACGELRVVVQVLDGRAAVYDTHTPALAFNHTAAGGWTDGALAVDRSKPARIWVEGHGDGANRVYLKSFWCWARPVGL